MTPRWHFARLFAAGCCLVAFDARAHSFGIEAWGIPFAIGLAGLAACLCLQLIHGRSSVGRRLLEGLGLALLDIMIWIVLVFLSFGALALMHIDTFDARSIPLFLAIGIWPWILPAFIWLRARRRRST